MGHELLGRGAAVSPEALKELRGGIGPGVGSLRPILQGPIPRRRWRGVLRGTVRSGAAERDREADGYMLKSDAATSAAVKIVLH